MRTDQTVLADIGVVPHLAMVIHFGSFIDDGITRNTFVDAAQSTNFNTIGNDNTATTLKFLVAFRSALKIISISSQNRIGVYDHIITNNGVIIDAYVGMNQAVLTNFYLVANESPGLNDRSFANFGCWTN